MSLTSALYSSVAGLQAQSRQLSAISENIANTSTTAYKNREVHFEALVTNSYNSASRFATGSVTTDMYQDIDEQGLIEQTGGTTEMAINGEGFFVVSDDTNNRPEEYQYTRNGDFEVDNEGFLVNNEGYYLYGQALDANGDIITDNTNDLTGLEPVNVNAVTGTASATSQVTIDANLPADLDLGNPPTNYPYNSTVEVFDSLGVSHSLDISWERTATNSWQASLSDLYLTGDNTKASTGTIDTGDGDNLITLEFNGDGTLALADGDGDGLHDDGGVSLEITGLNASTGANDFIGDDLLTLDLGTPNNTDGISQFAANTAEPDLEISLIDQDGIRYGELSGYQVAEDGIITALFDNGLQQPIYQLQIATFPNPNGLTHVNGTVYDENQLAGAVNINNPGDGKAGSLAPNSLELSNADTTEEFNKMIIAQQAYSASSQVLSTADEMFQTLIGIVN